MACWVFTLECNECGRTWRRNSGIYPDDDQAPYRRTGPCGHDDHTIKNILDFDEV